MTPHPTTVRKKEFDGVGLLSAGAILPVEAWHAAWIADIRRHGRAPYPAPTAFAGGKSKAEILAAVKGTGIIVG